MAGVSINSENTDLGGDEERSISQGHKSSKSKLKSTSYGDHGEVSCLKGNDTSSAKAYDDHSNNSKNPFSSIATWIR